MKSQVYKRLGLNFIILGVLFLCMLFSLPSYASEKSVLSLRNPYILEISTGASAGDEIGAIKISYTTAAGEERYKYLLPGGNDLGNSYKTAAAFGAQSEDSYGNLSTRIGDAKSYGYTFDGWDDFNVKGLQANTTDYYIVDFPEKVATIDLVELIPVLDQGDGITSVKRDRVDWQCLGFRFYEVGRNNGNYAIYGLGMTC